MEISNTTNIDFGFKRLFSGAYKQDIHNLDMQTNVQNGKF